MRLADTGTEPVGFHQDCFLTGTRYLKGVNRLTKQEQFVLCVVLGLLLTGLAVKVYRQAHPPAEVGAGLAAEQVKP